MNKREILDKVKGFRQHGAVFRVVSTKAARGDCPICVSSTRQPFEVTIKSLGWRCHACGENGNFSKFLALRLVAHQRAFDGVMSEILAEDRDLKESSLRALGLGFDEKSKLYQVPLFKGSIVTNIQRYSLKTHKPFGTTGGKRGYMALGGVGDATKVSVCEGPWDTAALWEGTQEAVIGIAGVVSGQDSGLVTLCQGKDVTLIYDHDNAGLQGDERSRELLRGVAKSIQSVHWPEDKKEHYDARDLWKECKHRPKLFQAKLKQYAGRRPRGTPKKRTVSAGPVGVAETEQTIIPQEELKGKGMPRTQVIKGFRKWMSMPEPEVLDVMYGTIFANRLDGVPVWMFIVGPSSCGKSEITMSLAGAPLIYTISTLTPPALISGKNTAEGADPSIIPKLDKHVLVIKDFTPILALPEKDQQVIFSVLRDAYDGLVEKAFGNIGARRYTSLFGIVSGVTIQIEEQMASHSIVGQRFLKFQMREHCKITAGEKAIEQALDRLDGDTASQMSADLKAISLAVVNRPVLPTDRPKLTPLIKTRLRKLAMWTAAMRGAVNINKYTGVAIHMPTSEIGTRLVQQLGKLAQGIAIFRGKKIVTLDEFAIVAKVASDSLPDIRQQVIRLMYIHHKDEWTTPQELVEWLKIGGTTIDDVLSQLVSLHLVELRSGERGKGQQYRIALSVRRLMAPLNLWAKERRWKRLGEKA